MTWTAKAEISKYQGTKDCAICNVLEDEFHFFFECKRNTNNRNILYQYFQYIYSNFLELTKNDLSSPVRFTLGTCLFTISFYFYLHSFVTSGHTDSDTPVFHFEFEFEFDKIYLRHIVIAVFRKFSKGAETMETF
jgi:hypothetical protein